MTRLESAAKWREKYPDRAAELRPIVRRYLGMGIGQDERSDFARRSCEVAEAELLGIVYGLPADPEPERPADPPPLQAAKKVLDLEEVKLSGRDFAAGVERESTRRL